MLSHILFRLRSCLFRFFFPRDICKSSHCGPFGQKVWQFKSNLLPCFCTDYFRRSFIITHYQLVAAQFLLAVLLEKVGHRYTFNYVDKVDTSFQFNGRGCSFSNVGLKNASFLANFCNGSLFSHLKTLSWFPEKFSTCHSVKVSWKLSTFLFFESFFVFICYGLALSSRIYTIFEQPSLEQFNLKNS